MDKRESNRVVNQGIEFLQKVADEKGILMMTNEKDLIVNAGIDFLKQVCEEKGIDPSTLRMEKVEDTFSGDSFRVVETEFSISSSEIETDLPVRAVKPAVSGTPVIMETAALSTQFTGDSRGDRDGDFDFGKLDLFNIDKLGKVTVSPECLLPVRGIANPSEGAGAVVGVDWGLDNQTAVMRIERPNQFPVMRPYSFPGEYHLQKEIKHKESNEERVCGFVDDLKYLACRHGLDLELTDILRLNDRKIKKTIGAVAMSSPESDGFIYHVSGAQD